MKKILIAAAALSALATTSYAADLPARMPVKAMPAPVVQSWTGCYLGAGGGYGMWNQDHTAIDPTGVPFAARETSGGRGWFGTAQFGCDYQLNQNWLVGAFVDGDWGDLKGDAADGFFQVVGRERQKWSWAGGGRVGYLIYPQLLGFVSAGYTSLHFDAFNTYSQLTGLLTGSVGSGRYDGWFVGTGYEYKLSWLPGLTWKTEYRATTTDNTRLATFSPGGTLTPVSVDAKKFEQTIRSELVWRFNWWR